MFDPAATKPEFVSWLYNVQDRFKNSSKEEIKSELEKTHFNCAVACEHWLGDFNMSTVLRNANGFNMKEVFYIGQRHWNRSGSVGTHHYTKLTHCKDFTSFYSLVKDEYTLIGIDNIPGSVSITDFKWPENTLMIFGEEGCGLTEEAQKHCKHTVYIPMFGSVRSFNCGVSSGIALYDYILKQER